MVVNDMYLLCKRLIHNGHGDKRMFQAYDCNCAVTGIGGNLSIKEDSVIFLDSNYLDGGDE